MNHKIIVSVAVVVALLLAAGAVALQHFTVSGVAGTYRQAVPGMGYRIMTISHTGAVTVEAHIPASAPPLVSSGYAMRKGDVVAISLGPDLKTLPADRRYWVSRKIANDGTLLPSRSGEQPYVPE